MEIRSICHLKIILPLSLILSCSINKGELKVKECEILYLQDKLNESAVCCLSIGEKAYFLFAMILADKGYYSKAKEIVEENIFLNSKLGHFVMGYIYYREGEIELAEKELLVAEKEGMKNPHLYLLLSIIYADKCKKNEAIFYENKLKETLKNPDLELFKIEEVLKRCSH